MTWPSAVALLGAREAVPQRALEHTLLLGEMALDGRLRSVRGVLPRAAVTGIQPPNLPIPE